MLYIIIVKFMIINLHFFTLKLINIFRKNHFFSVRFLKIKNNQNV